MRNMPYEGIEMIVNKKSLLGRLLMKLPTWLFYLEPVRIGKDTKTYFKLKIIR